MATYAEKADQLRKRYAAELAALRARRDLTEEGRAERIAKLRITARDGMRQLAKATEAGRATRRTELIAKLAANPTAHDSSSNHSYRAARAQAGALKNPAEAAALLTEARMTRDSHLERAVAMRCLDGAMGDPAKSERWTAVLNSWAQHQPEWVDDALTELSELERTATQRITESMAYSVEDPHELRGKNPYQLAAQAEGSPE